MLAYLIATSILNVLLGYALAVYLLRATEAAEFAKGHSAGTAGIGQSSSRRQGMSAMATDSDSPLPGGLARETPGEASLATPRSKGSTAAEIASPASARSEAADEEQLIAGIADFRSQLARLRTDTVVDAAELGALP